MTETGVVEMCRYSFIIPVYNAEKYIERCVNSVLAQAVKNFEIILTDDGSSDRSGGICDSFSRENACVKVLHQKNAGVAAARNKGIENAAGEYIIFVDADDEVSPHLLEFAEKNMSDADALVFCAADDPVRLDREIGGKTLVGCERSQVLKNTIYNTDLRNINLNTVWGKIFRRSAVGESRFALGVKIAEDKVFNLSVFGSCEKIVYTDAKLYFLRNHSASVTQSYMDGCYDTLLKSCAETDKFIARTDDEKLKHELEVRESCRMNVILHNVLLLDICHKDNKKPYRVRRAEYKEIRNSSFVRKRLEKCRPDMLTAKNKIYRRIDAMPFWTADAAYRHKAFKAVLFLIFGALDRF